jgi:hypothetical protein
LKAGGVATRAVLTVTSIDGTGRYRISFEARPGIAAAAQHYATIHTRLPHEFCIQL